MLTLIFALSVLLVAVFALLYVIVSVPLLSLIVSQRNKSAEFIPIKQKDNINISFAKLNLQSFSFLSLVSIYGRLYMALIVSASKALSRVHIILGIEYLVNGDHGIFIHIDSMLLSVLIYPFAGVGNEVYF